MIDLDKICDKGRVSLSEPFSFKLHGKLWDAASDGHCLVCVEVEALGYDREGPPVDQILDRYDPRVTHVVADVPAFHRWLDETKTMTPCDWCHGSKVHECNCCACEVPRGSTCPECEGDGFFANVEEVDLDGVAIDRVILARALSDLCFCDRIEVALRGELEPVEFRGPGWVAVVMPRRRSQKSEPSEPVPGPVSVAS